MELDGLKFERAKCYITSYDGLDVFQSRHGTAYIMREFVDAEYNVTIYDVTMFFAD